jgi:hypothetical protein
MSGKYIVENGVGSGGDQQEVERKGISVGKKDPVFFQFTGPLSGEKVDVIFFKKFSFREKEGVGVDISRN